MIRVSAYRLSDSGQTPEDNRVRITVNGASRDSIYAPASLEKLTDGRAKAQQDSTLRGRGLFGLQSYTLTEVSDLRPSELMVAEDWVNAPRNEAQARYVAAEAVYRKFVYENYTAVDEKLLPLLNRIFKEGETENDGIYSVVSHIREVLKAQASYTESVSIPHNEEDPIRYFLTASHKGNAVLYAAEIGLGVLGVLMLLATLLLCLLELLRMVLLWRERKCCQSFTPQERIFYKKDKLFWLLALWGMDAALGWETEKTDRALTLRLPAVSEGEYQRICSLLEKTVYGGIMLEPFEERALDRFLYHLTGQDMKKSLGMWLKLHYACLKKRK